MQFWILQMKMNLTGNKIRDQISVWQPKESTSKQLFRLYLLMGSGWNEGRLNYVICNGMGALPTWNFTALNQQTKTKYDIGQTAFQMVRQRFHFFCQRKLHTLLLPLGWLVSRQTKAMCAIATVLLPIITSNLTTWHFYQTT